MMRRIAFRLILGSCFLAIVCAAPAHSISIIEGDALVHRDKVELTLKVMPEDILLSAGMTLIVEDRIEKFVILKGAEAHKKYLLDGLIIREADGNRLTGEVTKVELPVMPDDGIQLENLIQATVVYHIEFPLAKPPASLSFLQHFNAGVAATPVAMELAVRQEGQDSGLTIPIPGGDAPESIAFKWRNAAPPALERNLTNFPGNAASRYWLFLARAARKTQLELLSMASPYWLFLAWAILLGALHGLEPGHSKGLMAAFIIGTRGRYHQAIVLALSATISHTAIVWLLAWPASYGGAKWTGQELGPYLNLISGIVVLALSLWMLARIYRIQHGHAHEHGHTHAHDHPHAHGDGHTHPHDHSHIHDHPHDHSHALLLEPSVIDDAHARAHAREIAARFSGRNVTTLQVILFGLGSGLAPCTAAVAILIGCFRLHQLWMGFGLVAAFSVGLGLTLTGVAVAASWSARVVGSRWKRFEEMTRKAPQLSALVTAAIGVYFIIQFFHSNVWIK